MDLELADKVVFVAGASRGIGYGIAEGFLEEGARVAITGRTAASLADAEDIAVRIVSVFYTVSGRHYLPGNLLNRNYIHILFDSCWVHCLSNWVRLGSFWVRFLAKSSFLTQNRGKIGFVL